MVGRFDLGQYRGLPGSRLGWPDRHLHSHDRWRRERVRRHQYRSPGRLRELRRPGGAVNFGQYRGISVAARRKGGIYAGTIGGAPAPSRTSSTMIPSGSGNFSTFGGRLDLGQHDRIPGRWLAPARDLHHGGWRPGRRRELEHPDSGWLGGFSEFVESLPGELGRDERVRGHRQRRSGGDLHVGHGRPGCRRQYEHGHSRRLRELYLIR